MLAPVWGAWVIIAAMLISIWAAMEEGREQERQRICQIISDGIRDALANGRTYTLEPSVYRFYGNECTDYEQFPELME